MRSPPSPVVIRLPGLQARGPHQWLATVAAIAAFVGLALIALGGQRSDWAGRREHQTVVRVVPAAHDEASNQGGGRAATAIFASPQEPAAAGAASANPAAPGRRRRDAPPSKTTSQSEPQPQPTPPATAATAAAAAAAADRGPSAAENPRSPPLLPTAIEPTPANPQTTSTPTATPPPPPQTETTTATTTSANNSLPMAIRGRRTAMCHQACLREKNVGSIYFLHMRKAGGTSLGSLLGVRLLSDTAGGQPGSLANATFAARYAQILAEQLPSTRSGAARRPEEQQQVAQSVLMRQGRAAVYKLVVRGNSEHLALPIQPGMTPADELISRYYYNTMPGSPDQGLAYYWNEGDLFRIAHLSDNTAPVVFLTHLRSPVARIISNYKMAVRAMLNEGAAGAKPQKPVPSLAVWVAGEQQTDQRLLNIVDDVARSTASKLAELGLRAPRSLADLPSEFGVFRQLAWTVVRNYYIRRLVMHGFAQHLDCARAARMLGGNVTRDDLELAKRILAQFDVVFITDDSLGTPEEEAIFDEAIGPMTFDPAAHFHPQGRSVLHQNLDSSFNFTFPASGWRLTVSSFHKNQAGGKEKHDTRDGDLAAAMDLDNEDTLAKLRRDNALDIELFAYARELVARRARAGRELHFLPKDTPPGTVPSWCAFDAERDQATCNYRWPGGAAANGRVYQTAWRERKDSEFASQCASPSARS